MPWHLVARSLLKGAAKETRLSPSLIDSFASRPAVVTDLPATGWTLLRPGYGWELAFRCGAMPTASAISCAL